MFSGGSQIDGASSSDLTGQWLTSGDVNGDGSSDAIVALGHGSSGVYVVYGGASGGFDLSSLSSTDGFLISNTTNQVVASGDVNGDGYEDVIIGTNSDGAYVVYGSASPSDIELASLTSTQGYRIDGASASDFAGLSVTTVSSLTGDKRPDLIIGAPWADNNSRDYSGSTYVIHGPRRDIDLALLTRIEGFRIDGGTAGNEAGYSIASAGYVNGDDYADLIIGAYGADYSSRSSSGSAYLIYGGRTGDIDLSSLSSVRGITLGGASARDWTGLSVAGGDLNSDGYSDMIVGAPWASNNSRSYSGSVYVVYGSRRPSDIDLSSVSRVRGYRIDGADDQNFAGYALATANNFNGGGDVDLILSAPWASNNSRSVSGSVYIL